MAIKENLQEWGLGFGGFLGLCFGVIQTEHWLGALLGLVFGAWLGWLAGRILWVGILIAAALLVMVVRIGVGTTFRQAIFEVIAEAPSSGEDPSSQAPIPAPPRPATPNSFRQETFEPRASTASVPPPSTRILVGGGLFVDPEGREPFLDLEIHAPYVVVRYYGEWAWGGPRGPMWIYHRHRDGALVVSGGGDFGEYVLLKKLQPHELERFEVNNFVEFVPVGERPGDQFVEIGDVRVNEDPVACPERIAAACFHEKNAWDPDVSFSRPPPG